MEITWYVEDGFVGGKSRPHSFTVDDAELRECESDGERSQLVAEYIQENFESTISWYHDEPDWSTFEIENEKL